MKLHQKLLSKSKYKLKCPYIMKPKTITIHNTYNDAPAENEVSFMISNNSATSFHIAVDDKKAIQGIPLNRNAWAAGDGNGPGNRSSIHVEICYSKSGGERYKKAEENAIQLVAQMLKERGWGVDRVRYHRDWSGKNCPHRILDEGRGQSVKNRIAAALKGASAASLNKSENKKEEESELYKPSNSAIKNSTAVVLRRLEDKDPDGIAKIHREKLAKGTLTNSDAIGLLYVAFDRGLIQGEKK